MSNLTLKNAPQTHAQANEIMGARQDMRIGHNTRLVRSEDGSIYATYYDNTIVEYTPNGVLASWAGWVTASTTTRLNMLTSGRFNIKQGNGYVNGVLVGADDWTRV